MGSSPLCGEEVSSNIHTTGFDTLASVQSVLKEEKNLEGERCWIVKEDAGILPSRSVDQNMPTDQPLYKADNVRESREAIICWFGLDLTKTKRL